MISPREKIVRASASFDARVHVSGDTSRSRVTLDVPEDKVAETAQSLRAWADELEGRESDAQRAEG